jgi:nitroreductase
MDTLDAIELRRSVKAYDPDYVMPTDDVNRLLELAVLSPTAFNLQHWRFVIIEDLALRQQLRSIAWDQAQVIESSLLIVLCADLKAWEKSPHRYWQNADLAVQDFILPAIDHYYRGKEQIQRDEALRSCGIAAQTLMLAAKAMGYDSCPMDGFDFDQAGKLIHLPDDHVISMMIAIGKALNPAHPRAGQLPLEEVVIKNKFS